MTLRDSIANELRLWWQDKKETSWFEVADRILSVLEVPDWADECLINYYSKENVYREKEVLIKIKERVVR